MDTTYQAQNSTIQSKIKSRDEFKRNNASQFDLLAQKLKRQLLGSYSGSNNQSSLPATPKSESKTISSSFQYPVPSKSPQQVRRKTIHNNLERVPETARPSYSFQSDSHGFKNKALFKAVVQSGLQQKRNKIYGSPAFHKTSRSQSKLSQQKGSLTNSRSPSTSLINQEGFQKPDIKTPSPLFKRPRKPIVIANNQDGLINVKQRVANLLSQYNDKFMKMQQEIHILREEN